ncbi:hypothetical protein L208DRAFT_1322593 [Tricholoma matsutake]|nr:hypothetical protein L208DRAFT_1322593 [Tricholoma matsutake 945]
MTTQATMPARGHSTAPKFDPTQPRELRRYFNKLKMLFPTCGIINSEDMKKHACQYIDIDTSELWESIPEYDAGVSFNEFHIAIHKLYPGSKDDHKWSIADMDKLISEQLHIGIYNANELGSYYRSFYNITKFLTTKNQLSAAEQSRAFVCSFQPGLWTRITCHLELKFPDHYPDDPYPLDDIHAAAKFVLAGTTSSRTPSASTSQVPSSSSTSTSIPTTSTSLPQIKTEDLSMILKKFVTTLVMALTGARPNNNNNNSPHVNQGFCQDQLKNLVCIFFGLLGHFISDCLVCQTYINNGKCKKNAEGKVVLPNGQFTPQNIPGHCIKDHIDKWIHQNPDNNIIPALMYGIAPSPTPAPAPRGIYQIMDMNTAPDIHIACLEQELYALQTPVVQPLISSTAPSAEPVALPTPTATPPSISSTMTNPASSNIAPSTTSQMTSNSQSMLNSQPLVSSQPPIHPYATASENTYLPPHERNFASTSKGKEQEGPSYHTVAPIQNDTIAQDIFLHSMKIPIVTLTMEELLSLSPKVCMKWKEQLTPHRILNQDGNNAGHLVNEEVLIINDPYETYISSL